MRSCTSHSNIQCTNHLVLFANQTLTWSTSRRWGFPNQTFKWAKLHKYMAPRKKIRTMRKVCRIKTSSRDLLVLFRTKRPISFTTLMDLRKQATLGHSDPRHIKAHSTRTKLIRWWLSWKVTTSLWGKILIDLRVIRNAWHRLPRLERRVGEIWSQTFN